MKRFMRPSSLNNMGQIAALTVGVGVTIFAGAHSHEWGFLMGGSIPLFILSLFAWPK